METKKPSNVHSDSSHMEESLQCLLHRIADKWAILILGLLEKGPLRFTALRREISGISQKMLTQTLRGLERDGIVQRTVYAQVPPRVEYALTPLGKTLCKPMAALRHWAQEHGQEVMAARTAYDKRTKGEMVERGG
jgi:DNA-binding HxlR family transcriptional regulator